MISQKRISENLINRMFTKIGATNWDSKSKWLTHGDKVGNLSVSDQITCVVTNVERFAISVKNLRISAEYQAFLEKPVGKPRHGEFCRKFFIFIGTHPRHSRYETRMSQNKDHPSIRTTGRKNMEIDKSLCIRHFHRDKTAELIACLSVYYRGKV